MLSMALRENDVLKFLDLFDVEFEDEGAIYLSQTIIENETLVCLYLSNTKISYITETDLLQSVNMSKSLHIFKHHNRNTTNQVHKISKNTFKTENRLDPIFTMIEEYYQIADYFNKEDEELIRFFHKYFDFVLDNWKALQKGRYFSYDDTLSPKLPSNKLILDSETIQANDPQLSEDSDEYKLLKAKD